jgi:hypothetical protein
MEAQKEEQRSVVRFLTAEVVGGREVHSRMSVVYQIFGLLNDAVFNSDKIAKNSRD